MKPLLILNPVALADWELLSLFRQGFDVLDELIRRRLSIVIDAKGMHLESMRVF